MNTRQKLTLGIAAIFMVTLTIVGVTYAYFLTRVEGEDQTENINVGTAEIADISYVEGDPEIVKLENSVPGEYALKSFGVNNPNDSVGTFDIVLTNGVPTDAGEFLHSQVDGFDRTKCYVKEAYNDWNGEDSEKKAALNNCFAGPEYDNVVFSLYESDGTTLATAADGTTTYYRVPVKYNATAGSEQKVGTFSVPAAKTGNVAEREFVLKVEYLDSTIGLVQNLEQEAQLNIKVDITDPTA